MESGATVFGQTIRVVLCRQPGTVSRGFSRAGPRAKNPLTVAGALASIRNGKTIPPFGRTILGAMRTHPQHAPGGRAVHPGAARRAALGGLAVAAVLLGAAPSRPQSAAFTTLVRTPLAIEGLTGDPAGNLFTVGRGAEGCPVWQFSAARPTLQMVGLLPAPCSPSGLAFDARGELFVADGDRILALVPSAASPPVARVFASGVPGTNGIAFDRGGNLWTGDGTTGQGRVWKIPSGGPSAAAPPGGALPEQLRVPPLASTLDPALSGVSGVGRDARTLPPGITNAARLAADTAGSQPLVANGVAFNRQGDLFIADTARGAIWKVTFDGSGNLRSRTGCDTAFPANTLCFDNVFVAHTLLEGVDGIVLDSGDNIWAAANERNAVVVVIRGGNMVQEVFRNPPDPVTRLRNGGPLEFPASPFITGRTFCTSSSDGNRRDNFPNTAGEVRPAGPDRGKISCMDI